MPTLHPQWGGYSYTWRRDLDAIEPGQFGRGDEDEQILEHNPFGYLIRQKEDSRRALPPVTKRVGVREEDPRPYLRRRLVGPRGKTRFSDSEGTRRRQRFRLFRGGRPIRRGGGSFLRHRHRLFVRDGPREWIQ